jgi:carbonic anhydrase
MKNLFEGVREFRNNDFKKNKELYKNLSDKQNPHTLFIACSDSRVIPNLITKSLPGELFVIRNIANIIPPYNQSSDFLSTTSAIEYAVKVLKVKNIVICGHSNCGGCKALFLENESDTIPYTKKWIELSKTIKGKIKELKDDFNYQRDYYLVEQENIVLQINNILTYPFIKEKYENNSLNIYGWYYDIGKGTMYNYNRSKKAFEKIE